ncbi:hypothetical protein PSHT_08319 [Puccinia striiformis]|uniref:ATP-dependent DNA helicase n=1 Tax=Puccinia striiformis TaxID=27350 RepID=A0A2S4VQ64_9BASI|nr:hypothetical protein PSHT_08319 [Puccinia striiformis]
MGRTFEHLSDRVIFLQSAATMLLINQRISNLIGGEPHTSQTEDVFYTPGCMLNEFSGVTPFPLEWALVCDMGLKTGMPVILMEHNFLKVGLVSGTQMIITGIYNGFLKAQLTAGPFKGDEVVGKMWFLVTHADLATQDFFFATSTLWFPLTQ